MKRYKEQDPIKVADFLAEVKTVDPDTIIYIDEMGIDTFIYREYAYSKRGEKVIGLVSGKKYERCRLVAGKLGKKIVAPLQSDGSMEHSLYLISC